MESVITVTDVEREANLQEEEESNNPYASLLRSRKKNEDEIKLGSRKLRKFYYQQNETIDDLLSNDEIDKEHKAKEDFKIKVAIYGSVIVNVALFVLQLIAAIQSKSLSLMATMADSFMDLLSGVILLAAERASKKSSSLKYPVGKTRIETAGIIVFAVLMAAVSIELIVQSIQAFVAKEDPPELTLLPILCVCCSLAAKVVLFIYCFTLRKYPSTKLLCQDHRNDLFVNSFGLAAAILASKYRWWIDPMGAIVVALIILRSWSATAYENAQLIVGISADNNFLRKITYVGLTHDQRIRQMDTARAYSVGNNYFVEVDIVLDPTLPLKEAHDIGESLQIKLERLPNVERAFVHLDYESEHKPEHQPIDDETSTTSTKIKKNEQIYLP